MANAPNGGRTPWSAIFLAISAFLCLCALPGRAEVSDAWEIVEEDVPCDWGYDPDEPCKMTEYFFRFAGRPEKFMIGRLHRGHDGSRECLMGYHKGSLKTNWLEKDRLVVLSTYTEPQGHNADSLNVVLLFDEGQWHEVYRNTYMSGGWHQWEDHTFSYDAAARLLTIKAEYNADWIADKPELLSKPWENEFRKGYAILRDFITEWRFEIVDRQLQYIGGRKFINLGEDSFSCADVGKFLELPRDDNIAAPADGESLLRTLNPALEGKDTCSGMLLIYDKVPEPARSNDYLYGSRK